MIFTKGSKEKYQIILDMAWILNYKNGVLEMKHKVMNYLFLKRNITGSQK